MVTLLLLANDFILLHMNLIKYQSRKEKWNGWELPPTVSPWVPVLIVRIFFISNPFSFSSCNFPVLLIQFFFFWCFLVEITLLSGGQNIRVICFSQKETHWTGDSEENKNSVNNSGSSSKTASLISTWCSLSFRLLVIWKMLFFFL